MWHVYFMLNAAIAIAYLLSCSMLNLNVLKARLSQQQRLLFARSTLGMLIILFFLLPSMNSLFPATDTSSFELSPLAKQASQHFYTPRKYYALLCVMIYLFNYRNKKSTTSHLDPSPFFQFPRHPKKFQRPLRRRPNIIQNPQLLST